MASDESDVEEDTCSEVEEDTCSDDVAFDAPSPGWFSVLGFRLKP